MKCWTFDCQFGYHIKQLIGIQWSCNMKSRWFFRGDNDPCFKRVCINASEQSLGCWFHLGECCWKRLMPYMSKEHRSHNARILTGCIWWPRLSPRLSWYSSVCEAPNPMKYIRLDNSSETVSIIKIDPNNRHVDPDGKPIPVGVRLGYSQCYCWIYWRPGRIVEYRGRWL